MTGFGHAERQDERFRATVEMRSVNNRFLEISVSLPSFLSALELPIRDTVAGVVRRGRVDVYVRVQDMQERLSVTVDRTALAGYLEALEELRARARVKEPVGLAHLLSLEGVLRADRVQDLERYRAVIEPLVAEALGALRASRRREGERLTADIGAQMQRVRRSVLAIEERAPQIEQQVRSNLGTRFSEVVGDRVEEARMLAEVAVQLSRFGVNEEMVRLKAHLAAFERDACLDEPVGKKLDFLCQEMHREINTTGSKSIVLAVSEQVVEAKDALENVREQLRNVE